MGSLQCPSSSGKKASHAPSSLAEALLPGHSFPTWNDRLRASLRIHYAQAAMVETGRPKISVLSAGALMHVGGDGSCLDYSVRASLPWATHIPTCPDWTRTLQAELGIGLLPPGSLQPCLSHASADGNMCPVHILKTPH